MKIGRYKFIWYWWPYEWAIEYSNLFRGSGYDWWLQIGPLEIRKLSDPHVKDLTRDE